MKAVLLSIQPKWFELIASGKKTVEVRKNRPKLGTPFKVYIYETQARTETPFIDEEGHHIFKGRGQVIGEFVCSGIDDFKIPHPWVRQIIKYDLYRESCVPFGKLYEYSNGGRKLLYGWHITDLVIYDKPKELSEFFTALSDKDIRCKHIKMRYTINGIRYNKCTLQNCVCEFRRLGHQTDCDGYEILNPSKPITRPPQSWCYVEQLQNEYSGGHHE